uniref:Uncharacterized protein ycf23 n=1 Tax=Acrosorium ciliolatum TaxID=1550622 RepID=A0A1Z1M2C8_9FLOR|nr:hypothetical protein [Acrosorium ciliolatum]ARW59953.1 hypothetical protein [Acrosorium ciliolatum]
MNLFHSELSSLFKSKKIVKVISGLNNNNIQQIIKIVKCAELSGASYIDIIANPKIVSIIKSITSLPICVSSIDPLQLYNCVLAGADLVEIGNFDIFYQKSMNFSSIKVLKLAIYTRRLLQNKDICVTIPHNLSLFDQIKLAKNLEKLDINILQTEGFLSKNNIIDEVNALSYSSDPIFCSTIKASKALASTYLISRYINLPVIAASGIDYVSSSVAAVFGASGVGISSVIKHKKTVYDMTYYLNQVLYSIQLQNCSSSRYIVSLLQKEISYFKLINQYF